ncbi:MAG: hypothetical protein RAM36_03160 [Arsenophonus sp.]|nr:hypothetical protein [Arsenophonus sp.]
MDMVAECQMLVLVKLTGKVKLFGNTVRKLIQRLPDGNTLILRDREIRIAEWDHDIIDNYINIISPEGKRVWHWSIADHFDKLGFNSEQQKMMKDSSLVNLFHINTA